jgi:hypothetical protein
MPLIRSVIAFSLLILLPSQLRADYTTTIEIVEAGALNQYSRIRLALDPQSQPQIAYWVTDWAIRYARKESGAWMIETAVDDASATHEFDVDGDGRAHLLYSAGAPVYAVYKGGSWATEQLPVPDGEGISDMASLRVDAQGRPHATFWSRSCGIDCDAFLNYASKESGTWILSGTWGCLFYGGEGEVDVDDASSTHFVVSCPSGTGAYYLSSSEWRWLPYAYEYSPIGFAVDPLGTPHIAYVSNSAYDLRYDTRSQGVWTSEVIDPTQDLDGISIALDASGEPHVAYYDAANGDLRYARRHDGAWSYQIVDGASVDVGKITSIAVDGDGRGHIAYFDATNSAVRYAVIEYDPTAVPTAQSAVQTIRVFPNPSPRGARLELRLDREDAVDLIVYDSSGRRVRDLATGRLAAGSHVMTWNGLDDSGVAVAPGNYFLRLTSTTGLRTTERVTIVR